MERGALELCGAAEFAAALGQEATPRYARIERHAAPAQQWHQHELRVRSRRRERHISAAAQHELYAARRFEIRGRQRCLQHQSHSARRRRLSRDTIYPRRVCREFTLFFCVFKRAHDRSIKSGSLETRDRHIVRVKNETQRLGARVGATGRARVRWTLVLTN